MAVTRSILLAVCKPTLSVEGYDIVGSRSGIVGWLSEFKAEIVELCKRGDRPIGDVSRDFDLTETAVRD